MKTPEKCECGLATGVPCNALLEDEHMVVDWMPEHYRASHEAAGNSGQHPHNGSVRLIIHPLCEDQLP